MFSKKTQQREYPGESVSKQSREFKQTQGTDAPMMEIWSNYLKIVHIVFQLLVFWKDQVIERKDHRHTTGHNNKYKQGKTSF